MDMLPLLEVPADNIWLETARILKDGGLSIGASARDRTGAPVAPDDPKARRWSLPGALQLAWLRLDLTGDDLIAAIKRLRRCIRARGCEWNAPAMWNDYIATGLDDVLALVAVAGDPDADLPDERRQQASLLPI